MDYTIYANMNSHFWTRHISKYAIGDNVLRVSKSVTGHRVPDSNFQTGTSSC